MYLFWGSTYEAIHVASEQLPVVSEMMIERMIVCVVAMVVYSRVDHGKREIVGHGSEAVELRSKRFK